MKRIMFPALAFTTLVWGLGCSSSNTETGSATTAETVAGADSSAAAATDNATGATTTQPLDSTSFPIMAASSDLFEILTSQEALKRGVHADVKAFAQQMITDHTATSTELKSIAGSRNILLPGAPLPMHQRMIQAISTENAKAFDETYMERQVLAHRTAVDLFETAAKSEKDPQLKAFAAKHLPHLKMHLENARKTLDLVE